MARISPDVFVFFLSFTVLLAFLAMMLGVWAWALGRIWRGIPLLAGVRPSPLQQARWGAVTVLALIFFYVLVNASVFRLYAAATGRQLPRAATQADQGDDAGKPAKTLDENRAARGPEAPGKVVAEQSQGELMLQLAVINTILLLLVPAFLRLTSGATLADLGIDVTDWKRQMALGLGAAMLMIPAVIAIQSLAVRVWPSQRHPVELMVLEQFTPGVALLAILSTVVLAPVIEEMLFRGIIQRWLSRLFGERSSPTVILHENDPLSMDDLTGDVVLRRAGEETGGSHRKGNRRRVSARPGITGRFEPRHRSHLGPLCSHAYAPVARSDCHLPAFHGAGLPLPANREPARSDHHAWDIQWVQYGFDATAGH